MKQLLQFRKEPGPRVVEVPAPQMRGRGLIVNNRASLISVGTERMIVEQAGASLIERFQKTPGAVNKLIRTLQQEGVSATLGKVLGTNAAPVPLGYSCAGTVSRVHRRVDRFVVGDRVACGGYGYASHAETVYVPANLAVKIPENVSFEQASFVTLGAIALQGVRLAESHLGERVAVIGLGLLGQLTGMLLEAAGCSVIGVELDPERFRVARELSGYRCLLSDEYVVEQVLDLTECRGVDATIIAAAAESTDPVIQAGHITRDKGKVVVVGAVRLDVPRQLYFNKELSLTVSRSYGPGRYDYEYEEAGRDYPYAYVRWTENRNMQAFLELIAAGKLPLQKLITHRFDIEKAPEAYQLVTSERSEHSLAVVLNYPERADSYQAAAPSHSPRNEPRDTLGIGLLGAGSFASNVLIPMLHRLTGCELRGVVSSSGVGAESVQRRVNNARPLASLPELLSDAAIQAVVIATRHHEHCDQTIAALESGKPILLEKPLCLDHEELARIESAWSRTGTSLLVDFNRRFAPLTQSLMVALRGRQYPLSLYYRINGGTIPSAHWIQDDDVGGGRVIGELCHFVDLLLFLTGALPVQVLAMPLRMPNERYRSDDNLQVMLSFADGSVGTINYIASGTTLENKEYLEVLGDGLVARLDDYRNLSIASHKRRPVQESGRQDKGHLGLLSAWVESVRSGSQSPIPFEEIRATTLTTFAILESLSDGCPRPLDLKWRGATT